MGKMSRLHTGAFLSVALLSVPIAAEGAVLATYGFDAITANSGESMAIGEAQLFVDVIEIEIGVTDQVQFHFYNLGSAESSITDVYFDDGTFLGIASISGGSGVSFAQEASPPVLPGGKSIDFEVTAGFLADSDPPVQPNGVNPGEYLDITFGLLPGKTLADVVDALDGGRDLRIGIHVQGFANEGSESFINLKDPDSPEEGDTLHHTPEPASLAVWGLGLAAVALCRRRRH